MLCHGLSPSFASSGPRYFFDGSYTHSLDTLHTPFIIPLTPLPVGAAAIILSVWTILQQLTMETPRYRKEPVGEPDW
jgi:hypothetical protein